MSIKSKVLATAAALTMVGGVGTAGVLGTAVTANAATPSCGSTCVDIFSQEFGHHSVPNFILDVYQQHIRIGQPIILYRSSNNDSAEDFRLEFQGTVADFYLAGMVSAGLALHYGCVQNDSPGGPDCFGLPPPRPVLPAPSAPATATTSMTRRSRSSTRRMAWTAVCASASRAPRCRKRA